jgi:hypothetical protein
MHDDDVAADIVAVVEHAACDACDEMFACIACAVGKESHHYCWHYWCSVLMEHQRGK